MTDPAGTTSYQYERRGLLRREERTMPGSQSWMGLFSYVTAFRHDAAGNRTAIDYPSGRTITYTHDFAGRPVSATVAGISSLVSDATYLPFGPLTGIWYGNGTRQVMQYDGRYRMDRNELLGPGSTMADYDYGYDPAGNVLSIADLTDAGYNRAFGYDSLNRLTTATTGSSLWGTGSYAYDSMGNVKSVKLAEVEPGPSDELLRGVRTDENRPRGRSLDFAYVGTTAKLQTVTAGGLERPVTHDAAGNEIAYGITRSYSPRNLLALVEEGGGRRASPSGVRL